jgi:hypothetical protein
MTVIVNGELHNLKSAKSLAITIRCEDPVPKYVPRHARRGSFHCLYSQILASPPVPPKTNANTTAVSPTDNYSY